MSLQCDTINSLATSGAQFNGLNEQQFQAAKIYLLALCLNGMDGGDYTDFCSLIDSLRPCDGQPRYVQNATYLEALRQSVIALGGPNVTADILRQATACWCDASPQVLRAAENFIIYELSVAQAQ